VSGSKRRHHSGRIATSLLARALSHRVTLDALIYQPLLLLEGDGDDARGIFPPEMHTENCAQCLFLNGL